MKSFYSRVKQTLNLAVWTFGAATMGGYGRAAWAWDIRDNLCTVRAVSPMHDCLPNTAVFTFSRLLTGSMADVHMTDILLDAMSIEWAA